VRATSHAVGGRTRTWARPVLWTRCRCLTIWLVGANTGCVPGHSHVRGFQATPRQGSAEPHSRDVLPRRELAAHPTLVSATAYDAIAGLRPEYLRPFAVAGGRTLPSPPLVIVDGNVRGGPETLRSINVAMVAEIRFVRPADAPIRYGAEARSGAIVVTSVP
jgi:hypothetical protein